MISREFDSVREFWANALIGWRRPAALRLAAWNYANPSL